MNLENHLKVIYKLIPHVNLKRRSTMVDYFAHKTNKVQLLFENISIPLNIVKFLQKKFSMLV